VCVEEHNSLKAVWTW